LENNTKIEPKTYDTFCWFGPTLSNYRDSWPGAEKLLITKL
jgi:hypothetical protein